MVVTLLLNGNDHGRDTLFIYFNTILRLRVLRRPRVLGFVIYSNRKHWGNKGCFEFQAVRYNNGL